MMTLPKFLARQGADRIVYRGMKGWGRSFSSVRGTALPINEFHAWYINQQHHCTVRASVRILYILCIISYFVYYIYYMLYIIYYILISNTTCTAVHLCRARAYINQVICQHSQGSLFALEQNRTYCLAEPISRSGVL